MINSLYTLQGEKIDSHDIVAMQLEDYTGPYFLANFIPNTAENMGDTFLAKNPPTVSTDHTVKEPFAVYRWTVERRVQPNDRSGEMEVRVSLTFINPEGGSMRVTSGPILDQWRFYCGLNGVGPFDPPHKIRIEEVKTGRGMRMYKLTPVFDKKA